MTEKRRRLHNKELYALYFSPNIIRVIKSRRDEGYVASMVDRRGAYRVFVGRSDGKRLLGRPRCRWKTTLKLVLKKWDGGME